MTFELLVATRYLRAKRKQAVISVITLISVLGVAAGVGALVVAMAMSEGQRQDIRERLLGMQAHVTVYSEGAGGIAEYREAVRRIEEVEGVTGAAPHIEQQLAIQSPALAPAQAVGIVPELESDVSRLRENIIDGSIEDLTGNTVAIGKELAERLNLAIGDRIKVTSGQSTGGLTGRELKELYLTVVAVYSVGLYTYDSLVVYIPWEQAVHLMGAGDVATQIDVKTDDIDRSEETGETVLDALGPGYIFRDWKETHSSIFQALKLERLGMTIAISLIVFVASLNIVGTLTMMVLEKTRDIATLMAMGANLTQIRRIFMLEGVIIGVVGTALGLVLGHVLSYLADTYRWISLSPDVYTISYLPFKADPVDSVVIAVAAVFVSFLATLYPSAAAAKLQPVEALRYE